LNFDIFIIGTSPGVGLRKPADVPSGARNGDERGFWFE
jgi:hypothetical protein